MESRTSIVLSPYIQLLQDKIFSLKITITINNINDDKRLLYCTTIKVTSSYRFFHKYRILHVTLFSLLSTLYTESSHLYFRIVNQISILFNMFHPKPYI